MTLTFALLMTFIVLYAMFCVWGVPVVSRYLRDLWDE